jgi:hypothetical protein|tara:strand:- start:3031 stop:3324 length:294 start_codon:yes stop_codon:yes gene_type:complete
MAKKQSETRIAFNKKFASERKKHGGDGGVFTFRGKKYTTDYAKTKKKAAPKKKVEKKEAYKGFDIKSERPENKRPGYKKANKYQTGGFLEPGIENID